MAKRERGPGGKKNREGEGERERERKEQFLSSRGTVQLRRSVNGQRRLTATKVGGRKVSAGRGEGEEQRKKDGDPR